VIPREKPLICHYPKKHNDSFVTECCKDYDYCNRDLKPTLHIKLPGRICYFIFLIIARILINNLYNILNIPIFAK